MIKNIYVLFLIFMVFVLGGFQAAPGQDHDIVLKDERLDITPAQFYISDVRDDRDNRTAVAWLIPAASKTTVQLKTSPVDLQGGVLVAVKSFIAHNLLLNKTLLPVIIHLKKFNVTETNTAAGRIEGHASLIMSFEVDRGNDEILHLADYNGNATYIRSPGPAQDIEPTLRHLLENGLVYINTWMDKQAGANIKLARTIKVTFTDFEEKPEGDTIYYNANRPLKWSDFQSKTVSKRFDAEVFPTIGYDEHVTVVKGVVNISLAIKVSMPKSACWVKAGSENEYTLNHEQRHFDIAKWVAEHFKQKIKTETLPVSNFDGEINVEYLETYREMDNLQKQYDDETRHGTDQQEQKRWNERIDKALKDYGVKQ